MTGGGYEAMGGAIIPAHVLSGTQASLCACATYLTCSNVFIYRFIILRVRVFIHVDPGDRHEVFHLSPYLILIFYRRNKPIVRPPQVAN